jgi:hypothetical protein
VFMAQGKRAEVSAAQRTDIWRRWKAGESLHEIGRAFGRTYIDQPVFSQTPRVPAPVADRGSRTSRATMWGRRSMWMSSRR